MVDFTRRFTQNYADDSYFNRKKAGYTFIFMIILLLYNIPIRIYFNFSDGYDINDFFINLAYVFIYVGFILLLYHRKLNVVVPLLICLGILRLFHLIYKELDIQLHIQSLLCLLTIGVINVKRYQLYVGFAAVNAFHVFRAIVALDQFLKNNIDSFIMLREFVAVYCYIIFTIIIAFISNIIVKEILESAELDIVASTDLLTGVFNRRKFEHIYKENPHFSELIIFIIDIDHFKEINDKYGHDKGDEILSEFAKVILSSLREGDSFYRWGGEEFIIALNTTDLREAAFIAERLRKNLNRHNFRIKTGITVSIGIAQRRKGESLKNLIIRADAELYKAKDMGRDRIEVAFE